MGKQAQLPKAALAPLLTLLFWDTGHPTNRYDKIQLFILMIWGFIMSRKNRFKEIKIKPKTYRVSGRGNKSVFTDICGIVATFVIILFVMWLRKNGYMIF